MNKGKWAIILLIFFGLLLALLMKYGLYLANQNQTLQHSDHVILRKLLNEKTTIAVLSKEINKKKISIGYVLHKHNHAQIPSFVPCKKFAVIETGNPTPLLWIENGLISNQNGVIDSISNPFFWESDDFTNKLSFYRATSSLKPGSTKISIIWQHNAYISAD